MSLLVVGLGNPSLRYNHTRHNVGREFVDYLADLKEKNFLLAKLDCFMNESGGPVKRLLEKENLAPSSLLVVVDDFMIPFGTLRLRTRGSSGGHNGLKSIIEHLGTEDFPRLRVGVGPVPDGDDPADFVLEKFTRKELSSLPKLFDSMKQVLDTLTAKGFERAMNETNKAHL